MKAVNKPLWKFFKIRNYSKRIQTFVLKDNTHRIRIIALVGALVNIGVTVASLMNSYYRPIFLKNEVYFRILWIVLSGFYLFVSKRKYYEKYKAVFSIINMVTLAGCLMLAAFISAMPFADHSYLIVFYTNMLLIGTLLYLSNIEMCLVAAPSLVIISALFIMYPQSVIHQESNYINIISVTFFSFIMAYVNYSAKRNQFNAIKIIEDQHKELYKRSTIDELTGLSNRRSINETLQSVMKESREFNSSLGLLMIDVDYFKLFNDFYGHLKGDLCLATIASVLKEIAEVENGFVGRFGGEEFLVVIQNKSQIELIQLGERICEGIRGLALPHEQSPLNIVTLSVGITIKLEFQNLTSTELIDNADRALYKAKANGRNRVEVVEMV